jgi:hypothetical protein
MIALPVLLAVLAADPAAAAGKPAASKPSATSAAAKPAGAKGRTKKGGARPQAPAAKPVAAVPEPELAPPAPPAPTPGAVRPERPRGTGAVAYVTAFRAYVDAGAEDGVSPGAELDLRRDGEPVGRCRIETLGPHEATCTGGRPRAGDTFRFEAAPVPPPPRVLPPPPSSEVMANRTAQLTTAPIVPVVFQGGKETSLVAPRQRAVDVSISDDLWDVSPGGTSQKQSLDILARGVPLASWLYLDLDGRLEHWSSRQNPVFLPKDTTRVYLWQAQLTAIPSDALSISAGRVLPWGIPGATVFDGGMAGWHGRWHDAAVEVGGFGGIVPEPDTLEPTSKRATAGGYWTFDRRVGGATFRTEGRLAAVRSPELGTRGEATLTGRFYERALDASGEATFGMGGKVTAPSSLDAARADVTWRPFPVLALGGSFQYSGLEYPQTFEPPAFPGRSRQATVFASWDVRRWLRLGLTGGTGSDLDSGLDRKWLGPEVTLPDVLWGWGTLSGAYLEERGWMVGRSAWAQLTARPAPPLRLLLRGSWSHDDGAALYGDEVGATLGASYEFNRSLALRVTGTGRTVFGQDAGSTPRTLTGRVALTGGF